jgi:hypothetical protein
MHCRWLISSFQPPAFYTALKSVKGNNMARLFIEIGGKKYEKKFKHDKTPFYVDTRGKVIEGTEAQRLDESLARHASRARSRSAVELRESTQIGVRSRSAVMSRESAADPARRQRIEQEAAIRRRAAQARKRTPSRLSEAERTAKRVKQLMSAGMNEKEARIAAVGRYVDSLPCE